MSSNFNAYDYQWGKFGQNLLRNQHEIISDRTRLLEVLNDSDCELISTVVLDENLVRFFSNNVFFPALHRLQNSKRGTRSAAQLLLADRGAYHCLCSHHAVSGDGKN